MNKAIRIFCALAVAAAFTACGGAKIEGTWVEPVPGMENMTQGIKIESDGKASSVNMATLQYESWEKEGNSLILTGKSIGNHQTLEFTDKYEIRELTGDKLVLKREDGAERSYTRQE